MDIELSDGTVIEGVPEGTTQTQLLRKLYYSQDPSHNKIAHSIMKQQMSEKPWGSGIPKVAYDVGGSATDLAAKAGASPELAGGAGWMANVATQAIPAFLSGGRITQNPTPLAEKPAKWILQTAVKPSQADRVSGAAGKALTTMLQENIGGTAGGMDKAAKMARAYDQAAETALNASPAAVSMNAVGTRLEDPARRAVLQVNPQSDISAIKSVWENFKNSPAIQSLVPKGPIPNIPPAGAAQAAQDVSIPVQLAHQLKKGTYQSLGGKSYGEIGSASTEAQKALARGLREEVATAVPEAATALGKEAKMMNILDVVRDRVLLDANKNPMGLAALRIGDNPLSAASFLADRSAYLKSLAAQLLYRGSQPELAVPYGTVADTARRQ